MSVRKVDSLSAVEQHRIKLEEAAMKKRVAEEKRKKELELLAKEEQRQQRQNRLLSKSKTQPPLPPLKEESRVIKTSEVVPAKQRPPSHSLKQIVSISDFISNEEREEEQAAEDRDDSSQYEAQKELEQQEFEQQYGIQNDESPSEVDSKGDYAAAAAGGGLNAQQQYLISFEIQEQMKKIKAQKEAKKQEIKIQNMRSKQQIIEKMLVAEELAREQQKPLPKQASATVARTGDSLLESKRSVKRDEPTRVEEQSWRKQAELVSSKVQEVNKAVRDAIFADEIDQDTMNASSNTIKQKSRVFIETVNKNTRSGLADELGDNSNEFVGNSQDGGGDDAVFDRKSYESQMRESLRQSKRQLQSSKVSERFPIVNHSSNAFDKAEVEIKAVNKASVVFKQNRSEKIVRQDEDQDDEKEEDEEEEEHINHQISHDEMDAELVDDDDDDELEGTQFEDIPSTTIRRVPDVPVDSNSKVSNRGSQVNQKKHINNNSGAAAAAVGGVTFSGSSRMVDSLKATLAENSIKVEKLRNAAEEEDEEFEEGVGQGDNDKFNYFQTFGARDQSVIEGFQKSVASSTMGASSSARVANSVMSKQSSSGGVKKSGVTTAKFENSLMQLKQQVREVKSRLDSIDNQRKLDGKESRHFSQSEDDDEDDDGQGTFGRQDRSFDKKFHDAYEKTSQVSSSHVDENPSEGEEECTPKKRDDIWKTYPVAVPVPISSTSSNNNNNNKAKETELNSMQQKQKRKGWETTKLPRKLEDEQSQNKYLKPNNEYEANEFLQGDEYGNQEDDQDFYNNKNHGNNNGDGDEEEDGDDDEQDNYHNGHDYFSKRDHMAAARQAGGMYGNQMELEREDEEDQDEGYGNHWRQQKQQQYYGHNQADYEQNDDDDDEDDGRMDNDGDDDDEDDGRGYGYANRHQNRHNQQNDDDSDDGDENGREDRQEGDDDEYDGEDQQNNNEDEEQNSLLDQQEITESRFEDDDLSQNVSLKKSLPPLKGALPAQQQNAPKRAVNKWAKQQNKEQQQQQAEEEEEPRQQQQQSEVKKSKASQLIAKSQQKQSSGALTPAADDGDVDVTKDNVPERKGHVAMTIDFSEETDELAKKKRNFEARRLKKIQEFEANKQRKLLEIQQKYPTDEPLPVIPNEKKPKQLPAINAPLPVSVEGSSISTANAVPNTNRIIKKGSAAEEKASVNANNRSEFSERPSVMTAMESPAMKPRIAFQKASNKLLISQAIAKVCLAGPASKEREITLKKIKESAHEHFIVLFKGINGRQDFKALYTMDSQTMEIKKLCGLNTAPPTMDQAMIQTYYRYDSGAKEFKELLVKNFSNQVDAVLLKK